MTEIYKEFHLESAHRLPNVPPGHKCLRLHGHSYVVVVHVRGDVDPHTGMVCDFAEITAAWQPIHAQLDHNFLNEVPGLENPTSEVIAEWIWNQLIAALPQLCRVIVRETCTCGASYSGPS